MNHPYLYPDEAPWTEDYQELRDLLRITRQPWPPDPDDDNRPPLPTLPPLT